MAAIDNYNLALDGDFRKKVRSLMLKSALAVSGESNTDKKDSYIQKRGNAANFTIYNQSNAMDIMSHLVAAGGALTDASTDNDIEFTINSVWDDYSGLTLEDKDLPV